MSNGHHMFQNVLGFENMTKLNKRASSQHGEAHWMPPSASLPAKREVRCREDEIKSFQAELRLFLSSQGNS